MVRDVIQVGRSDCVLVYLLAYFLRYIPVYFFLLHLCRGRVLPSGGWAAHAARQLPPGSYLHGILFVRYTAAWEGDSAHGHTKTRPPASVQPARRQERIIIRMNYSPRNRPNT